MSWMQHGGSGLGWSFREVLLMSVADRNWFLARVGEQREREAQAIEKAGRGACR